MKKPQELENKALFWSGAVTDEWAALAQKYRERFEPNLVALANTWKDETALKWVDFWTTGWDKVDGTVPHRFYSAASFVFASTIKSENRPAYVLLPPDYTEPRDPLRWYNKKPTIWNTIEWPTIRDPKRVRKICRVDCPDVNNANDCKDPYEIWPIPSFDRLCEKPQRLYTPQA